MVDKILHTVVDLDSLRRRNVSASAFENVFLFVFKGADGCVACLGKVARRLERVGGKR